MSQDLASYTEEELLEELVRRKNGSTKREPEVWCDDCANFKTWAGKNDPPDSYNPCIKKHEMKFWTPADYEDPCGYYRRVCGDRTEII